MKKVLLIEDDRVLRENTAELLELNNYKVFTAPDGQKGLDTLKVGIPDIIICDIMMPELDGYGVLEALSKNDITKKIPFIFLSAKTERKDVRKGMELGADDYLTKPFEESELIGAIESRLTKVAILKEIGVGNELPDTRPNMGMRTINDLKNHIDDNGEELSFDTGEIIYREGKYPNMVFLVIKGVVKTHKLDEMGKELITGIYKPDDFFGFTSFTENMPYAESASALEKTELVGLPKEELRKLLDENHDLSMVLIQMLSENLAETKEQLLQMAYGLAEKKRQAPF